MEERVGRRCMGGRGPVFAHAIDHSFDEPDQPENLRFSRSEVDAVTPNLLSDSLPAVESPVHLFWPIL